MSLPAPNLDDRRFQDLVDDAMRSARIRLPEWSPTSAADPGVVLVELLAWMTDQLIYRLNRVPDRNYIKFLDLIGVRLIPPTSARTDVTFWLTSPQPAMVIVPSGTQVSTIGTEADPAIVFTTVEDLTIPASSLARVASVLAGRTDIRDHTDAVYVGTPFTCFDTPPKAGDSLLIGLAEAVPSCAVTLQFQCRIDGVGVDPSNPPLAWEAWASDAWTSCEVERDDTGGLNRDGEIVLHVPRTHVASVISSVRAAWLRARVLEPDPAQPFYAATPTIVGVTAAVVGGTVPAVNAELIHDEVIGTADGRPGGRFSLKRAPVVPADEPLVIEVDEWGDPREWTEVRSFAASGPEDRHFVLDAATGEVSFGPVVGLSDGTPRGYGLIPPAGASIKVPAYRTGGGSKGNVMARTLVALMSSIPFVARVENRRRALGGTEGEDIESAKVRGPLILRTRDRAVTVEDFEQIALEAAPDIARVRCVQAGGRSEAPAVRVLVVPTVPPEDLRVPFGWLVPSESSLEAIVRRLDECRVIGTRVIVEPPTYRGVTVVARLRARPRVHRGRLQQEALDALYQHLHPTVGGPDKAGWPFGRPLLAGEIYAVLQGLAGTELVEDVRLFGADPIAGERGPVTDRLEVEEDGLVFSYEHQVLVEDR